MAKKPFDLADELATQLMILRASWLIAGDDNRRTKALYVSPSVVRRWSKLIRRAGSRRPTRRRRAGDRG